MDETLPEAGFDVVHQRVVRGDVRIADEHGPFRIAIRERVGDLFDPPAPIV